MIKFLKENRLFSKLTGINLLSKIGDKLFYTALLTASSGVENAGFAVMIVSVSETLPILMSIFIGVIADKKQNKLIQIVRSSFFRALMYLGIGILFHFTPTFYIIIWSAIFNFMSDMAGNYSSALFSPFTKSLIAADQMEKAQGVISLSTQIVTVLATFIGAFVLTISTESILAVFNAGVFFVVSILYWMAIPKIKTYENRIRVIDEENPLITIKDNLKLIISGKRRLIDIVQLAMLNGFFGGLSPIFAIFIFSNNELNSISRPVKISILSGLITVFMILGNAVSVRNHKTTIKYSIDYFIADLLILIVGVGFLMNSIWIIYVATAGISWLLGIVSPKFSAEIVNEYPIERLGGIVTSVNALLVLTPPITSMVFPFISTTSRRAVYWAFIVYGLVLIGITGTIISFGNKSSKLSCKKAAMLLKPRDQRD